MEIEVPDEPLGWDDIWDRLANAHESSPIPHLELVKNVAMFQDPGSMRRFLFFDHIWRNHVVNLQGSVFEFGVRWGRDIAWFGALHWTHEPEVQRNVIGFDTFAGHLGWTGADGTDQHVQDGAFAVPDGYQDWLYEFLKETVYAYNSNMGYFLAVGDVRRSLPKLLGNEHQTLIAFAYFDLDLFEPTLTSLIHLIPYLQVGSVLGFDELDSIKYPGEGLAVRQVFGNRLKIERMPWGGSESYAVMTPEALEHAEARVASWEDDDK